MTAGPLHEFAGVVREIAEKLADADPYALDWPLPQSACNCLDCCENVVRFVLAALVSDGWRREADVRPAAHTLMTGNPPSSSSP